MEKQTLSRDQKLFRLSIILLVLSLLIVIITAPFGLPVPDYDRNVFNSISAFGILFFIAFMELSTIFYYRSNQRN